MARSAAVMVVLAALAAAAAWPTAAGAAGCEVMAEPAARAECAARAQAREAAREQVRRELDGGAVEQQAPAYGTGAWRSALAAAERGDVRDVLEPRPLAAVGGLVWFLLALRSRRRRARRSA